LRRVLAAVNGSFATYQFAPGLTAMTHDDSLGLHAGGTKRR